MRSCETYNPLLRYREQLKALDNLQYPLRRLDDEYDKPPDDKLQILVLSIHMAYIRHTSNQQSMFLDVACCFLGHRADTAKRAWLECALCSALQALLKDTALAYARLTKKTVGMQVWHQNSSC